MNYFGVTSMTISFFELNYNENGMNILVKRASEGDKKTVTFLLEQGDSESMKNAVYGYAIGGHVKLLEELLKLHPECLSSAAQAYARIGADEKIKDFPKTSEIEEGLACGYGEAGNEKKIRELLNQKGGAKYLSAVIRGLATTNQAKLLSELVFNTSCYPVALKAAAKAGHTQLVKQLLSIIGIDLDQLSSNSNLLNSNIKRFLAYILEGYTEGGHCAEASQIMSLGINPMFCITSFLVDGQIKADDVQVLLSQCDDKTLQNKMMTLLKEQFDFDSSGLKATADIKFEGSFTSINKKIQGILDLKMDSGQSNQQNYV